MLSKMKVFTQGRTAVEQGSWDLDGALSNSRTYPVFLQVWPSAHWLRIIQDAVLDLMDLPENLHFNRSQVSYRCMCCNVLPPKGRSRNDTFRAFAEIWIRFTRGDF